MTTKRTQTNLLSFPPSHSFLPWYICTVSYSSKEDMAENYPDPWHCGHSTNNNVINHSGFVTLEQSVKSVSKVL